MTPTVPARRDHYVLQVGALALVLFVFLFGIAIGISAFPHNSDLGTDFMPFCAAGLTLRHSGDPYNWAQLQVRELHLRSMGNPALGFTFVAADQHGQSIRGRSLRRPRIVRARG